MIMNYDAILGFVSCMALVSAGFIGYQWGKAGVKTQQQPEPQPEYKKASLSLEEQTMVQEVQEVLRKEAEGWENIMSFDPVKAMQEMKQKEGDID